MTITTADTERAMSNNAHGIALRDWGNMLSSSAHEVAIEPLGRDKVKKGSFEPQTLSTDLQNFTIVFVTNHSTYLPAWMEVVRTASDDDGFGPQSWDADECTHKGTTANMCDNIADGHILTSAGNLS